MDDKIEKFENWLKTLPKFKQFFVIAGVISLGIVAALCVIIALGAIFIWTIHSAFFVNPWFSVLALIEVAIVLASLIAFAAIND